MTASDSGASTPLERFGRYELLHLLARGGMAEIFVARAPGIGGFEKLVVIKRILPEMTANKEFVGLFLDEARLAGRLHHSNIAQVFDAGLEDGRYFMAMEYVHGRDVGSILREAARRGESLPLAEALAIVTGVCAGLHYAHEQAHDGKPLGLIHRDVSPSNILVTYDGWPKLVDFGIAKAITRTVETRQGRIRGKAAYMSPEQVLGRALDRRSDLFSLGTVLYEMTTMTRLFKRATDFDTMKQLVEHPAPPPGSRVPGYPNRLEEIVLKALARDRDRRYQTAEELQSDLEDFAQSEKLAITSATLARYMAGLFPSQVGVWELMGEDVDRSERLTPKDAEPVVAEPVEPELQTPAAGEIEFGGVDDRPTEVTPSIFVEDSGARPAPPVAPAPVTAGAANAADAAARYHLVQRSATGMIDPPPRQEVAMRPAEVEVAPEVTAPPPARVCPITGVLPPPATKGELLKRVRSVRSPGLASPLAWLLLLLVFASGGGAAYLATRPPAAQSASAPASQANLLTVQVVSMPPGARVWLNGTRQSREAPGTFQVPRAERLALRLELEGYTTHDEIVVVPAETASVLLRAVLRPNAGDAFDHVEPAPPGADAGAPASAPASSPAAGPASAPAL